MIVLKMYKAQTIILDKLLLLKNDNLSKEEDKRIRGKLLTAYNILIKLLLAHCRIYDYSYQGYSKRRNNDDN